MYRNSLILLLLLCPALGARASAPQPIGPLSAEQAIAYAIAHHPALQVRTAAEEARHAQVAVSRSGYLPNLDLSAQLNVGTGNVLRGALFPMREIPNVSGPPTGRDIGDASLGSTLGIGVGWDVLGLVRQMALVDASLAEETSARASTEVMALLIGYAAADRFIDVLARAETVRAARATVDRARVFSTTVKALVDQDLRPGAEYSRAAAELALASTQLIHAEQAEAVSRAELAQALGAAGHPVQIVPGRLLDLPPVATPAAVVKNPEIAEADAAVRAGEARKHALDLQYLPRLDLVGSLWVRGSGLTSGTVAASPGAGIVPDTPNWVAGVVLTWPALELVAVRARSRVEAAQVKGARAHRAEVMQIVQTQMDTAHQVLLASRRVAENTPIALQAARDAERQALARYRSGLAGVVEVAEAQRLLAQAEIDDAVARLNVRRAQLLLARALGDLNPFVNEVHGGP